MPPSRRPSDLLLAVSVRLRRDGRLPGPGVHGRNRDPYRSSDWRSSRPSRVRPLPGRRRAALRPREAAVRAEAGQQCFARFPGVCRDEGGVLEGDRGRFRASRRRPDPRPVLEVGDQDGLARMERRRRRPPPFREPGDAENAENEGARLRPRRGDGGAAPSRTGPLYGSARCRDRSGSRPPSGSARRIDRETAVEDLPQIGGTDGSARRPASAAWRAAAS